MSTRFPKIVTIKDGSAKRRHTIMQKLGKYTFMYANRACNVASGKLKSGNTLTETPTGFVISNYTPYAKAVHVGHKGPIPPNGYAGNPWMIRGLSAALKLLGVNNTKAKEG